MDDIRALFFGVAGGVLGAFFKFWIEDLRNWQKGRLTKSEKALLFHMKSEFGIARFKLKKGLPPSFGNRYEDIDNPEANFRFTDHGETVRLLELGLIERVETGSINDVMFRLTGKGHGYVGHS